jgi:hypothetical protein
VAGHWEGDLITGAGNRSAIGTLAGRASRFTILLHVPGPRHTAEAVTDSLMAALAQLPAPLRRSVTWDQGKEMAFHAGITQTLGMPVFFCDPHAPWQRPTNENTYWCRMSDAGILRREMLRRSRWVTRRTRAEKLSVDMSTAARRARALTGSDLIEAC